MPVTGALLCAQDAESTGTRLDECSKCDDVTAELMMQANDLDLVECMLKAMDPAALIKEHLAPLGRPDSGVNAFTHAMNLRSPELCSALTSALLAATGQVQMHC